MAANRPIIIGGSPGQTKARPGQQTYVSFGAPPGGAAPQAARPQGFRSNATQFGMQPKFEPTQAGAAQASMATAQASNAAVQQGNDAAIQGPVNPNSTQNSLQLAEIRDGIVIMNDGSFRSVIMMKSINFDLMSQGEQEAVEYSYQQFLNSLYFPVQIVVSSRKVDLQPYIDKLDKIRSEHDNMLLALLMEDYIEYIDGLSQQTNIMDKKFYIIVPFSSSLEGEKNIGGQSKSFVTGLSELFSTKANKVVISDLDLEKAKTELRNRVQAVLSGLMQCGVQGLQKG